MKRKFLVSCAIVMSLLALTACGNKQQANTNTNTANDSSTTAGAKTIAPLATGVDVSNLDNCTVAVSFEKGDAYVDDNGAMQLKAKLYTYDTYDMVDVSQLAVGDTINILQQDVPITSLEREDDGTVVINGGMDNGGYDLVTSDNTVFYLDGFDDAKQYYELGEATIPVSDAFQFDDSSDPTKDTVEVYYADDFLNDETEFDFNFVPNNTTITIEDGKVVHMERVYMP